MRLRAADHAFSSDPSYGLCSGTTKKIGRRGEVIFWQSYDERWRKARPYAFVIMFIFFVPGLTLSLVDDVQLLPASIIRTLYPYSILPWEKALVVTMDADRVAISDLSHPSALNEQSVVVAFVSFFLVFLVFGLQTWADALFSDQSIKFLSAALLALPAVMLLRIFVLYKLFERTGAVVSQQPVHWNLFPKLVFGLPQPTHWILVPEALVFSTVVVAAFIHAIARIAYLYLAGRYAS
jgi:hypothetical protein